jgi:small subunit ribosomal protein S6
VVLSCTGDEESTAALLTKFKDLIAKNGTVESVDEWGKRKLAYPINDETEGYYTVINFSCEESFPAELDRVYKITDGVLRTLIVAKGE